MSNEDPSRRGFLKGAGLIAGAFLGESVLPDAAAAQSGARSTAAAMSAEWRARAKHYGVRYVERRGKANTTYSLPADA